FWISDELTNVATLYNGNGIPQALVVSTPVAPTGVVFNTTTSFQLNAKPSLFLFATESGEIAGWNAGTTSPVIGFIATDGARYTGLTEALSSSGDALFAADFHNGKIDVIDSGFVKITLPGNFIDPTLPAGFLPYNVQALGGQLYVTYAKIDVTTGDPLAGAGLGVVDVFNAHRTLSP